MKKTIIATVAAVLSGAALAQVQSVSGPVTITDPTGATLTNAVSGSTVQNGMTIFSGVGGATSFQVQLDSGTSCTISMGSNTVLRVNTAAQSCTAMQNAVTAVQSTAAVTAAQTAVTAGSAAGVLTALAIPIGLSVNGYYQSRQERRRDQRRLSGA